MPAPVAGAARIAAAPPAADAAARDPPRTHVEPVRRVTPSSPPAPVPYYRIWTVPESTRPRILNMPDNSFDVVSKIEIPEVLNAVQQAH